MEALKQSPIELWVGLTDANTGESVVVSKNETEDFFELLRASCAIPYFYGKKVFVNDKHYYDGTIGSVSGLEYAADEQNILIVLTRSPRPLPKVILLRKILRWLLIRHESPVLQEAIWNMPERYNQLAAEIDRIRKSKNIAVIQPNKSLPMFRIDNRLSRLRQTIEQGYNDTMNHSGLDEFFENFF